jgi:hypothetical protein
LSAAYVLHGASKAPAKEFLLIHFVQADVSGLYAASVTLPGAFRDTQPPSAYLTSACPALMTAQSIDLLACLFCCLPLSALRATKAVQHFLPESQAAF